MVQKTKCTQEIACACSVSVHQVNMLERVLVFVHYCDNKG
jgi:hypothetical protein